MTGYNFPKNEGLKETLAYLMDRQSEQGTDRDGNMLLICLVSLMSLVDIMQKQIISGENVPKSMKSASGLVSQGEDMSRDRGNVTELKTEKARESKITAAKEQTLDDNNASDKIVNKVKNKTGEITSKIVKWDSMLKKKNKEPLSI